jgi:hypothetical protein
MRESVARTTAFHEAGHVVAAWCTGLNRWRPRRSPSSGAELRIGICRNRHQRLTKRTTRMITSTRLRPPPK